jgi:hypothetical protein
MRFRRPSDDPVWKKAKRGYRGDPVLTVAFYGPDDQRATKVAVGLRAQKDDQDTVILERIVAEDRDVRYDPAIRKRILQHFEQSGAKSVAMARSILGCPHEEGKDYAEGTACPHCPFWAGRDRFSALRAEMLARSLAAGLFDDQRVPRDPDDDSDDEDAADPARDE